MDYKYEKYKNGIRLLRYTGKTKDVVVPEKADGLKVIALGSECFEGIKLNSIVLPDCLEELNGNYIEHRGALHGTGLLDVQLPANIRMVEQFGIDRKAFAKNLIIPDNLVKEFNKTFIMCETSVEKFVVSDTCVNYSAYEGLLLSKDGTKLIKVPSQWSGEVIVPEGVVDIGDSAFEDCKDITSVKLPSSVTTIGENAFRRSGLQSMDIPTSVTSVGEKAFFGCRDMKSIRTSSEIKLFTSKLFDMNFAVSKILKNSIVPLRLITNSEWKYDACIGYALNAASNTFEIQDKDVKAFKKFTMDHNRDLFSKVMQEEDVVKALCDNGMIDESLVTEYLTLTNNKNVKEYLEKYNKPDNKESESSKTKRSVKSNSSNEVGEQEAIYEWPVQGKKVYVSADIGIRNGRGDYEDVDKILSAKGAKCTKKLSKNIDYIVYSKDLPYHAEGKSIEKLYDEATKYRGLEHKKLIEYAAQKENIDISHSKWIDMTELALYFGILPGFKTYTGIEELYIGYLEGKYKGVPTANAEKIEKLIKSHKKDVLEYCFKNKKSKTLKGLISLYSKLPAKDVDLCIENTAKWNDTELTAFLIEYKESKFDKKKLVEKQEHQMAVQLGLVERTLAEWKKIYTFTEDEAGNITIMGYKGEEKVVEVPEFIDKKPVVAIDLYAFCCDKKGVTKTVKDKRSEVQSIHYPQNIKFCGNEDWYNMYGYNLKEIYGPKHMIFIEDLIFYKCVTDSKLEKDGISHNGDALENCTVGDIVTFGTYTEKIYEDNTKYVKETKLVPYDWEVIKSEGNKRLLMLKSGNVDGISDGTDSLTIGDSSWERTFTREWLNNLFYNYAFSDKEKALILDSKLKNNKGKDTIDKVFLLSIEEAQRFFDNEKLFHEKMGDRFFRDSSESGNGVKVYDLEEKKIIDFDYNVSCFEPSIVMWIDVSKK